MDRKEAIKIVRGLYEKSLFLKKDKEAIETLIPEIKDDEDERIRKYICRIVKEHMRHRAEAGIESGDHREALQYLEKQKEQKPEIKYVYPKFRKGDVIEPITPNGHYEPVRVVGIWDGSYSCRSDDDKAYLSLPIKREDEYRLVEQKPAEWSEKDERVILDAYCWLAEYAGFLMSENKDKAKMLWGLSEKLKSLRPQPKQEWNEEDEKMKTSIVMTLASFMGNGEEISWLKSLPERFK